MPLCVMASEHRAPSALKFARSLPYSLYVQKYDNISILHIKRLLSNNFLSDSVKSTEI